MDETRLATADNGNQKPARQYESTGGGPGSEIDAKLDRLYVTVKSPLTGNDELLRFQWMRLHPATAVACLAEDGAEGIPAAVAEAARNFPIHQEQAIEDCAASHKNHMSTTKTAAKTDGKSPPLLKLADLKIDLREYLLLDPPLLSPMTDAMFHDGGGDENDE
jgi:hypothetical protein